MQSVMRSNRQLIDELRQAPDPWIDSAIVVAFEDRFEFVGEDHLDPMGRLDSLQEQGGLAIGLASLKLNSVRKKNVLSTRVFREYANQAWGYPYMEMLGGIVRGHCTN